MAKETKDESRLLKWLGRIFSIQTFALIASIIAAWYTYKTYKENQAPQISVGYISEAAILPGITYFCNDSVNYCYFLTFSDKDTVWWLNGEHSGLLYIANNTNKSIKNFELKILIGYDYLDLDIASVDDDFIIIKRDTVFGYSKGLELKYKYDVLNPHTEIPVPIKRAYMPKFNCTNLQIFFDYTISYDRMDVPSKYLVFNFPRRGFSVKNITDFLDDIYKEKRFNSRSIVGMQTLDKMLIFNPPKELDDEKFENFKSEFLEVITNASK